MSIERHPNRRKSQRAKLAKFWCGKCDGDLVGQHGKCRNCGTVQYSRKTKQKTPTPASGKDE